MSKFAKIENGVVSSIIVSEKPFVGHDVEVPAGTAVRLGTPYADGVFDVPLVVRPKLPKALSRVEFVRHCQSVGGMTDAMLVAAKGDANLGALWIILEMSGEVHKDAPEMPRGLAALEALGYLPNGPQAVLDGWPVQ